MHISSKEKPRRGAALTIVVFILLFFGLVMLSSAGIVDGKRRFGSESYYLVHQLLYGAIPGLIIYFVLSRLNFKIWKNLSFVILLVAILLTAAVFIPHIGLPIRGVQRWIRLGPILFQPSEPLKLALVLYLAAWFGKLLKRTDSRWKWTGLIPFGLIIGVVAALLIKQPDLGTLGITIIIAGSLYFLAGADIKHIIIVSTTVLALLIVFAIIEPYRFERIKTFLDPQSNRQGSAYHINQALISIGSGGIFGLGYGQSRQKFSFLPEPVGDSIYAIVVEELGLVGGIVLIGLYLMLFWCILSIAGATDDPFARLFTLGMGVWIIMQAFINIAAISGLIPLTGVPLPFVSYGSSSLISILTGLGIVRNIARKAT